MKKSVNFTLTTCLLMACWMTAPIQKVQAQAISPNVMEITYVVPGSYSITVPAWVVYTAEAWGGGGGGGSVESDSNVEGWGGGGGGGAYAAQTNRSHPNPQSFSLTVGKGGDGGDTSEDFFGVVHCNGGEAGGNSTVAIPALMINMSAGGGAGGDPGIRTHGTPGNGGARGGDYDVGTSGQNGGTGGDSTKGGDCPNGGAGAPATQGDNRGDDGDRPGGGGGGAKELRLFSYRADGGNGGDGRIRLTLNFPVPAITSPTTQFCQGSVLTLSVTDPASAHVNYKWYRNGVQVGIGTEYDAGSDGDYTVRAEYIIPYTGASPIFRQASGSGNSITTTVSNTITLTTSEPPQINPITMNSCSGEAITVTPLNGVHGFVPNGITYQWTVLQNTGGITGATNGNSGVTSLISLGTLVNPTSTTQTIVFEVTPGSVGCTNVTPFQISVNVKPAPQINPMTRTVCSGESISITPANGVDGVVPGMTAYLWTVVSNTGVTGASSGNSGNSSTIYLGALSNTTNDPQTVVYEVTPNYEGCTGDNFQLDITVEAASQVLLISTGNTYCAGESVTLTANVMPAGNYTYDWYLDNVLIVANGGNTHISTGLAARATSYNYYVIAHSAAGCDGQSNDVAITVTDPETVVVTLNYTDICQNGTIRATANIPMPENYIFKWFLDNVESGYERLFSATNLSVGAHTLRVEATPVPNCVGCETSSASVGFTVHPNPVVTIAADNTTICAGNAALLNVTNIALDAAVNNKSHYTLQWALDGTVINGATQDTYTQTLTNPGKYAFTLRMISTDDAGCESEWSAPVTVTVEESPQVMLVSENTSYCVGSSTKLTANVTPAGNYIYDWYLDNTLIVANGGNTHVSQGLAARATSYNYYVIAHSAAGCDGQSNDVAITVTDPETVVVTLNYTDICESGTIRATANIAQADNYSYKWFLNSIESGYGRQFSASNLPLGEHTLYVEAKPLIACVGCEITSTPVTFNVHPNPEITIAADNAVICSNEAALVSITNIALDAAVNNKSHYTLQWALNGTVINGATQDTYTQALTNPGKYTFTLRMISTDDVGCESEWSAPVTVTVEESPQVMLVSDDDIYCAGGDLQLTATVNPAGSYTYKFYLDNVLIASGDDNTFVSQGLAPRSNPYSYYVVAVSANGCEGSSNNVNIIVKEPPTVVVTADLTDIGQGGSVTATANVTPAGNYNFVWYLDSIASGYEQQFIMNNPAVGVHNVYVSVTSVEDYNGCEASSEPVKISVHSNPGVSITADNPFLCSNGMVTLTATISGLDPAIQDKKLISYQWALNGVIIPDATLSSYNCNLVEPGIYIFNARLMENDILGWYSEWSTPVTVTVTDIETPEFFTTNCSEEITGAYRTVYLPLTVHVGNPQAYTIAFTDLTRSIFNYSGIVRRNISTMEAYIEARLPLEAGDYELVIDIDGCLHIATGRVMVDSYALGGAKLIEQRWDDVLTVNNNPETNGGFLFYSYQWYKDNVLIPGATKQDYTEKDGKLNAAYQVELRGQAILSSGQTAPVSFFSCPFIPVSNFTMSIYPVPAGQNESLTFETSLSEDELEGAALEIYDVTGLIQRKITNLSPKISIDGFKIEGLYFGRLFTQNNGIHSVKFIISK